MTRTWRRLQYTREYIPEESLDFHFLSQITFKYHAILRGTLSTNIRIHYKIFAVFVQRLNEVVPELAQPQFRREAILIRV